MIIYVVERGDTLYSIARRFGVTVESIVTNNELDPTKSLVVGQTIVILYPTLPEKLGQLYVNGYAYPFIDEDVLERTLPDLSSITLFTYGFTPTGELVTIDDEDVVEEALEGAVDPILLISTLTNEGTFSNELASLLLNNAELQDIVIQNLLDTMREKGYVGLDIDFEYVLQSDRQAYVDFIEKTTQRMNEAGFFVIVALAPKTSAEQKGLLYEAHDYESIGAVANYVLIMTYEWGYTYGPPEAVAPLNKVEAVVQYAVSAIPREKIYMGIPNYGYDWALPFQRGVTKARSLGNVEAVDLAREVGAEIKFDDVAKAPYFNYYDASGVEHVVWFEDARSIRAKLELANRYGLRGVSYWNLMRYFPQNWLVLRTLFNIGGR